MYVLIFAGCVVVVAVALFRHFGHALRIRTDKGITGFFYPKELLRKGERTFLSLICLIPLTTLFYASLYYAKQFDKNILKLLLQNFGYNADTIRAAVKWYEVYVPEPFLPVIVTLFLLLFLGSKFSRLQETIEEGVMYLFGIRRIANKQLDELSSLVLKHVEYQHAVDVLENSINHPIRLPRELLGGTPSDKFSFQLLQLAKARIPSSGFHEATLDIVNEHFKSQIPAEEQDAMHLRAVVDVERQRVYRIVVTYVLVAAVYVVLVPAAAEFFAKLEIVWPKYGHLGIQMRELVVRGLAAFFPAAFGLLYIEKRWHRVPEARKAIVFSTVCIVVIWSTIVNVFHVYISILQQRWSIQKTVGGAEFVAGLFPEFVYVLNYSIAPAAIIVVLNLLPERGKLHVRKSVIGAILFGLIFFFRTMVVRGTVRIGLFLPLAPGATWGCARICDADGSGNLEEGRPGIVCLPREFRLEPSLGLHDLSEIVTNRPYSAAAVADRSGRVRARTRSVSCTASARQTSNSESERVRSEARTGRW